MMDDEQIDISKHLDMSMITPEDTIKQEILEGNGNNSEISTQNFEQQEHDFKGEFNLDEFEDFQGNPPDRIPCDICFKDFSAVHVLKFHKLIKHKIEDPTIANNKNYCSPTTELECIVCGQLYNGVFAMKNLKFHLRTRHNFTDYTGIENWKRTFKCNTCDSTFPDETKLKEHIENEHENMNTLEENSATMTETTRTFSCSACNCNFEFYTGLYMHIKTFHQENKKEVLYENSICDICMKAFDCQSNLDKHIGK